MITIVSGVALIAAAVALLYAFTPREGAETNRGEWADASIAIAAAAGLAVGAAQIVVGAARLLA